MLIALCAIALFASSLDAAPMRSGRIGRIGSIIAVHRTTPPAIPIEVSVTAGSAWPFPRPRLAGFQPLVAITTSSKTSNVDIDYEHKLEESYGCQADQGPTAFPCGALNPSARANFIVGVLDSGSTADLASGLFADTLGLNGSFLTQNPVPIGGVGGQINALVTQPVGFYAAGLSAVNGFGQLDVTKLRGHSNSAGLVAPPIICGDTVAVTGFVGTPLIAFYNTAISVDIPRRVTVEGITYKAPDVQLQSTFDPLPEFTHAIALELGGIGPVATASYFPDFEDLETPIIPTMLSLSPISIPTGGSFFATVQLRQGPSGPNNLPTSAQLMFDTGSQASIISRAMAAELNLPLAPDFTVDVCGVNGVEEGVPGYYIDYTKISALGGALEFSRSPFIVEDLPSPAGGTLDGILGMNFFWNRNSALEPSLTESSFFEVSEAVPFAFGDVDADRYVDADDAFLWILCNTAPGEPVTADCDHLDGDFDGDVDLRDFAAFQRCFSGPDVQADPNCGF